MNELDGSTRGRSHRRTLTGVIPRRRWQRALLSGFVVLTVVAIVGGWYAWATLDAYREARASIDDVEALVTAEGSGQRIHPDHLPALNDRLREVQHRLDRLDDRIHSPVLTATARRLPFLGSTVRESEELVDLGIAATDLAVDSSQLANEIYEAYTLTGFSGDVDPNAPTWLSVVQANRDQIDVLLARFDQILVDRDQIDEEELPQRGRNMLARLDPLLNRARMAKDRYAGLLDYYPVVEQALGMDRDGRYLVLLQNSQELRQSGGFPGTYAMVTVRDGRLAEYEFFKIGDLSGEYSKQRSTPTPAPAPIREYLKQEEWLPGDVGWAADFRDVAELLLQMYEITGQPPVQGVVAVGDRSVEAILATIGPVEVTFEGETLTVTSQNVIDTIESYRAGSGERHKEAVKAFGTAMMDRIKASGFDIQSQLIRTISDYADRREIQLYAVDPTLQSEVAELGWDGALEPELGTPTLGMTISNIIGNKASRKIFTTSTIEMEDARQGMTRVTWTITLDHTGDPDGDLRYNGFHRTWLALYLPDGATLTQSSIDPAPASINDDPRAVGYHIELYTGEQKTLRVRFEMPMLQSLILRRQPGANDVAFNMSSSIGDCSLDESFSLWTDYRFDLATCMVGPD